MTKFYYKILWLIFKTKTFKIWFFSRIGNQVVLHFIKECQRCNVITVDPETGTRDMTNIEELRKTRLMAHGLAGTDDPELQKRRMKAMAQSPFFSVNFGIDAIGHVNVGDDVYAEFDA
jgi:hypothetical protein